ncbi:hypothetical protein TNCV_146231, partial [Trichonephila clavipes]
LSEAVRRYSISTSSPFNQSPKSRRHGRQNDASTWLYHQHFALSLL